MNIITKFTIATDEGTDIVMQLARALAKEKFTSIIDQKILDEYINVHFTKKQLVSDMNELSNQWLVVYVDGNPAGYAKITSRGERPQSLQYKRAFRIADFGILEKYSESQVKNIFLEKCLSVCKNLDFIWMNEFNSNPLIDFFVSKGFVKQSETYCFDDLELSSVCLIYQNNNIKSNT